MQPAPRVLTIPASTPFLPALIAALMDDRLGLGFAPRRDPFALATATLYLPTRRACRLARDMFLHTIGGDAAILPRIVPIGDPDEDEIAFSEAALGEALEIPDALGGLERQALLTELILAWARRLDPAAPERARLVASTPASAFGLAADLARLMDDIATRQVSWDKLDSLVPAEVDRYWQLTLEFLTIARQVWPAIVAERDRIEPAERRDRLIAAEARRVAAAGGPVIAAGSTGSMPSTALLLDTIARLPQGAVVLPGLDTDLEDRAWDLIPGNDDDIAPAQGHPQFAMQALLARIGIARRDVIALAPPQPHGRERLVSEALRPAAATEHWQSRLNADGFPAHADAAMQTVTILEAANAEEEALAIAVALRETHETPGRTAALVTPDRALARRVLAALARWSVPVDDSGGDPLADTPDGVFARLVIETAQSGLAPVPLLALLKHPLCRLDARATAALELAVFRGPRPRAGCAGLVHALAAFRTERDTLHRTDPRRRLTDEDLDRAQAVAATLTQALEPLEALGGKIHAFSTIAARHREAVKALGDTLEPLDLAFDEIAEAGRLEIAPSDYPELFRAVIAGTTVRRPEADVRIRILGPLEARLQHVDRVVLGGLVEGVWPPETQTDPWLSRPMRQAIGLDLPERRIGLSAHDFAQALGSAEVILSRAAKLGGAPTVASRFVQRLAAVAGEARWKAALERGARLTALARLLDEPAAPARAALRPAPRPPFEARPRQLSVTEIEHWLRDPYTIYARHVLKLFPIDAVDTPPGAADRGTLIHNAIGDYAKAHALALPPDPVAALLSFGAAHFAPLSDYPEARAFWWPRFQRIADWFARYDAARRTTMSALHAEIAGSIAIPFGDDTLRLTVRADRIEALADGRYAILDYKTGAPPTEPQVRTGLSPQLTLEAAILRNGGFKGIPAGVSVSQLIYVRLSGGLEAGEERVVPLKDGPPDDHADRALARLTEVAARFADPQTPYVSLVHPMWSTHYGTYDHLARVKEWSLTGGTADSGGDA